MNYSITEISNALEVTGGRIIDEDAIVSQLLTDSRSLTMPEETIFFALRTDAGDGHNYIPDLFDKGVRNFVVAADYYPQPECAGANYIAVESPLDALQALATFHRRRFRELPVIGITGSRGKTAVKEWLYQLLKDDYRIVRSPRSYNSQIGVPLSLWDIDNNTDLAIIEAGISRVGEMDNLQSMIRPTIGIITNLGSEHNDGFSSMEQKAQEKAKILFNCEGIVFCADDPLVTHTIAPLVESDVAITMSWSRNHCDAPLQVDGAERTERSTTLHYTYDDEPGTVTIPFTADRDLNNAITCLAVLLYMGLERDTIAQRMAALTPVGTRLNVIEGVNNCTVIVDSYTSDYNSLTPALNFMTRRAGNRPCTVILSDLSNESYSGDELYIRVSELLKTKRVNRLVGIGKEMCRYRQYFEDLPMARFFNDTQEFINDVAKGDFEDETVLIKGDPSYGFSQIIDLLEAKQHITVMEVDLNALAHNFKFFKSLIKPGTKTIGMVKASGYGAGSYEIAKTLQDCGCDYLAVAVHDEGVDLRKASITMPIIVLNPNGVNYKAMFQYRLEPEPAACTAWDSPATSCPNSSRCSRSRTSSSRHRCLPISPSPTNPSRTPTPWPSLSTLTLAARSCSRPLISPSCATCSTRAALFASPSGNTTWCASASACTASARCLTAARTPSNPCRPCAPSSSASRSGLPAQLWATAVTACSSVTAASLRSTSAMPTALTDTSATAA